MDLFVAQPPINHSLTPKHWLTRIIALMQPLSNCYQKTFKSASNPHKHWISELNFCHCATPFDTFFVNLFDTLLSFQNRSQNRTATCTTHTPHPKMKISRLQNHLPELFFLIFFFFQTFCHVLCDFYSSFQVPKPPVFAAFSLLQGILLLILFFLFLRQKNLISGESPETRFLVVLWYF